MFWRLFLLPLILGELCWGATYNEWCFEGGHYLREGTTDKWVEQMGTDTNHWVQTTAEAGAIVELTNQVEMRVRLYADHMDLLYPGDTWKHNYRIGWFGTRKRFTYTDPATGRCSILLHNWDISWQRREGTPDVFVTGLRQVAPFGPPHPISLEDDGRMEGYRITGNELSIRHGLEGQGDPYVPVTNGTWTGDR